jgi:hypothetical protein
MQIKLTEPYLSAQMTAGLYHLRRFNKLLPEGSSAYISGGFLRDLHHGFGCRDVDIFYYIPEDKLETHYDPIQDKQVMSHLSELPKLKVLGEGYGGYDYCEHQGIQDIYEYTVNRGTLKYREIQLIRLKCDPVKIITDFPINMSRIWMGIDGIIHTDISYDWGYENSTMKEMHGKQWNYMYLAKILGRYNHYAFYPHSYFDNQRKLQRKEFVSNVINLINK